MKAQIAPHTTCVILGRLCSGVHEAEEILSKILILADIPETALPIPDAALSVASFIIAAALPVLLAGILERRTEWLNLATLQAPDLGAHSSADKTPTVRKLATLLRRTDLRFEVFDQLRQRAKDGVNTFRTSKAKPIFGNRVGAQAIL